MVLPDYWAETFRPHVSAFQNGPSDVALSATLAKVLRTAMNVGFWNNGKVTMCCQAIMSAAL